MDPLPAPDASTYSLITDLCQHLSAIDGHRSSGHECPVKTKQSVNNIRSKAFEVLFSTRHLGDYGPSRDDSTSLYNNISEHIYSREKAKGKWSKEKNDIIEDLSKKAETLVESNPALMNVFELLMCLADSSPQSDSSLKHCGVYLHSNRTTSNEELQSGFKLLNCTSKFNHKIFDFEYPNKYRVVNNSLVDIKSCNLSPGMGLKHDVFFTTQTSDIRFLRSDVVSVNQYDVTNSNWILTSLQSTSPLLIENSTSSRRGIQQDEGYVTPDQDMKSFQQLEFHYTPWEDMDKYDVRLVFSWESYGDYKTKCEPPFLSQSKEAMQHIWNVAMSSEVTTANCGPKIPTLREIDLEELKTALRYLLVGEEFNGIFHFNEVDKSFALQDGLHFSGSSSKILREYCEEFIECSNSFYEVSKVIEKNTESRFSNSNGIVYQVLCSCIERYLRLYRGVVQHMPGDRLSLLAWVHKLCVQLQFLCSLCRPDEELELRIGGRALLARLYDQVPLVILPEVSSLLYGILQSCCTVYFLFLEKWIFEGHFEDVHKEFFIECCNPSELSYNRKFWTRGFCLNRMLVPGFLKGLENDIFICGKTLALLRLCATDEPVCQRVKEGYPGVTCCLNRAHLDEIEGKCHLYKERCKNSCSQKYKLFDLEPTKDDEYYAAVRAKSLEKIIQAQKEEKVLKTEKKHEQFEMLKKNMEDAEARKLLDKRILLEEEAKYIKQTENQDQLNNLRREEERDKIKLHYIALSLAADKRKERAEWKIKRANLHDKRVKFYKELKTIESGFGNLTDGTLSNCEVNPDLSVDRDRTPISDYSVSTSDSGCNNIFLMSSNVAQTDSNHLNHELISEKEEWSLALDAAEQTRQAAVKIKERNMFNDYNILTGEVTSYHKRFCTEKIPTVEQNENVDAVDVEDNNQIPAETYTGKIQNLGDSHIQIERENTSVEPVVPEEFVNNQLVNATPNVPNVDTIQTKPEVAQVLTKLHDLNIDEIDMTTINHNLKMSVMIPLMTQLELANEAVLRLFLVTYNLKKHFECIRKYFFLLDGEFSSILTNNLFISIQTGDNPSCVLNVSNLNSLLRSAVRPDDDEYSERLSFYVHEIPQVFRFIDPNMLDCLSMRYQTHWPLNVIITDEAIVKYDKVFKFLIKLQRTSWALEQVICLLKENSFFDSKELRQIHLYRHIMTHFIHSLKNYVMTVVFEESWFNFSQEMQLVLTLNDIHSAHVKYVKTLLFKCLLNKRSHKMQSCVEELLGTILLFHQVLRAGDQPKTFVNLCNQFDNFVKLARFLYKYINHFVNTGYQPHLVQLLSVLSANDFYSKE